MKTKNNQNVKPIKVLANAPLYGALLVSAGCIFGQQKPIQDVMSVQEKNKDNDHKILDEGQDTTQDGQLNAVFTSDSPIESDKGGPDAGSKQQPGGSSKAAIEKDSNKAVLSGENSGATSTESGENSGATSTESGENKQDQNQIIDDPNNNKNEGNNTTPQDDDQLKNSAGSSQTDHNASSSLMPPKPWCDMLEFTELKKKTEKIKRLREEISTKECVIIKNSKDDEVIELTKSFVKLQGELGFFQNMLQDIWDDNHLPEYKRKNNIREKLQGALDVADSHIKDLKKIIEKNTKKKTKK
ncbi:MULTISPECIES: hypothetical protein [Candidatus Cardinium]|uniref:hypothetical protein n=1 Tax=Candidatus Cardinium TaxID=273135 RepID=UPI001FAA7004|nr:MULTISPECIES: hypothetical protein [Cardinium]